MICRITIIAMIVIRQLVTLIVMTLKLSPGSCQLNPYTPCQRTRSPPSAARCWRPQHPNNSRNPKHPNHPSGSKIPNIPTIPILLEIPKILKIPNVLPDILTVPVLLTISTVLTDHLQHNFFFKAAAIIHMILNNLDPAVAQFPQELVTYGGNGQVGPRSLWSVSRSRLESNFSANVNVKRVRICHKLWHLSAWLQTFTKISDILYKVLSNWGQFRLVLHYLATMRW